MKLKCRIVIEYGERELQILNRLKKEMSAGNRYTVSSAV